MTSLIQQLSEIFDDDGLFVLFLLKNQSVEFDLDNAYGGSLWGQFTFNLSYFESEFLTFFWILNFEWPWTILMRTFFIKILISK